MNTNQEKIFLKVSDDLNASEKKVLTKKLFSSLEKMIIDVDKISIALVEDSLTSVIPFRSKGLAKRPKCLN